MRFRLALIISMVLICSGCGVFDRMRRGPEPGTQTYTEEAVRYGNVGGDDSREAERPPQRRETPAVKTAEPATPPSVRPPLRFSGIETEHVRLSSINYFPGGGIDLCLDDLCGEFCYPLRGKFISDYGMRNGRPHTGIDIKAAPGDTIRAAFAGVVRMSRNYSGYGNIVVIRHYQGFETAYAHNSKNLVAPNDAVEAGDPIALAGRTGRATTEHLHFEFRAGGDHLDPKLLVDPVAMALRTGKLFIRNHQGMTVASYSEPDTERLAGESAAAKEEYESALAQAIAESTVDGKPKGTSQPEPVYYRVKKNDNLSSIALRHGTTVSRLCELNGIKSTSLLQIDQRLRVK